MIAQPNTVARFVVRSLSYVAVLLTLTFFAATPTVAQSPMLSAEIHVILDVAPDDVEGDGSQRAVLNLIAGLAAKGSGLAVWQRERGLLLPVAEIDAPLREQVRQLPLSVDEGATALIERDPNTAEPAADGAGQYDLASLMQLAVDAPLPEGRRRSIVVISDGRRAMPASPVVAATRSRNVVDALLPALTDPNVQLFAVALSSQADWDVLRTLANASHGYAYKAFNAEARAASIVALLERVLPTTEVPIDSEGRFTVDDSIGRLTVALSGSRGEARLRLISPDGQRLRPADVQPGVSWTKGLHYATATLEMPRSGEWTLEGEGQWRARVVLGANSQLAVDTLPATVLPGETVELAMAVDPSLNVTSTSADVPASRAPVRQGLEVVVRDVDGRRLSTPPISQSGSSGDYVASVVAPELPGEYGVTVLVKTAALQRRSTQYFTVLPGGGAAVISTRALDVPMEDIEGIATTGVLVVLFAVAALLWLLQRRRQKKLATYASRLRD